MITTVETLTVTREEESWSIKWTTTRGTIEEDFMTYDSAEETAERVQQLLEGSS